MFPLTVIIITKNEEANILACIQSARQISDDIVIVDSGSTDDTVSLLKDQPVTLIHVEWECFGTSRNIGASYARHEWIFSLDADERISPQLANAIHQLELPSEKEVFRFKRKNFLGGQPFRFGTVGFDRPIRLYNRKNSSWDLSPVHEELMHCAEGVRSVNSGRILHYSMKNIAHYRSKLDHYASLCALKYLQKGKQATLPKRLLSPIFNSFKSYILQLGFLDGVRGFQLAKLIFFYSYLKYKRLYYLHQKNGNVIKMHGPVKASA